MQQLKTDEFPLGLDRTFRNDLIDNFKIIQQYLDGENDYDSIKDQVNSLEHSVESLQNAIAENNDSMQKKINSILLGTDVPSVKIVVEQILKDKGVI